MTGINLASPHAEALSGADSVSGRSLWQDAWRRLRANRAAVASFVGPYLLPWSYDELDWEHVEALPPDFALGHYFGTDSVGRDLLARTLMGGRVSLMVGVLATAVALLIGVTVGAVAGFVGGRTDQFLMRFVDLMYSVPLTFFVIILMVVFGRRFQRGNNLASYRAQCFGRGDGLRHADHPSSHLAGELSQLPGAWHSRAHDELGHAY
jgi:ABC-type dipeptide/oligopeptide/nickel transport system permease subunit